MLIKESINNMLKALPSHRTIILSFENKTNPTEKVLLLKKEIEIKKRLIAIKAVRLSVILKINML